MASWHNCNCVLANLSLISTNDVLSQSQGKNEGFVPRVVCSPATHTTEPPESTKQHAVTLCHFYNAGLNSELSLPTPYIMTFRTVPSILGKRGLLELYNTTSRRPSLLTSQRCLPTSFGVRSYTTVDQGSKQDTPPPPSLTLQKQNKPRMRSPRLLLPRKDHHLSMVPRYLMPRL